MIIYINKYKFTTTTTAATTTTTFNIGLYNKIVYFFTSHAKQLLRRMVK